MPVLVPLVSVLPVTMYQPTISERQLTVDHWSPYYFRFVFVTSFAGDVELGRQKTSTGWPHPRYSFHFDAAQLLAQMTEKVCDASDNLWLAKTTQAIHANSHRSAAPSFAIGDKVLLATKHHRRDYLRKDDKRVAKLMLRYDVPFSVLRAGPASSTYTLDLPPTSRIHPTFHAGQLRPYIEHDTARFPCRERTRPAPVVTDSGVEKAFIDRILDERKVGRGMQYLVRWRGFGAEDDEWLTKKQLDDCEALDVWEGQARFGEDGRVS